MTVRILAVHTHPLYCNVCDGHLFVKASRVGPHGQGAPGARRWLASRLAEVIPCPQCSTADGLRSLLPRDDTGETS